MVVKSVEEGEGTVGICNSWWWLEICGCFCCLFYDLGRYYHHKRVCHLR